MTMTVRECGARFSFTKTGRCVLSPGHKGEHKEPGGYTWPSLDVDYMTAAWRARFPEVDRYMTKMQNHADAMRQAAKREAFGKSAGYHGPAWNEPVTDAQVKGTAIHKAVEESMKPKCAVCPASINHNNPHAVFCSSNCASRAATHYNAANTTLDDAITAEGEKYGKELTDTLHKQNEQWADNFRQATKTADRALRFLCGLNLQDRDVKEQREALAIVRELQAALKPGKAGK